MLKPSKCVFSFCCCFVLFFVLFPLFLFLSFFLPVFFSPRSLVCFRLACCSSSFVVAVVVFSACVPLWSVFLACCFNSSFLSFFFFFLSFFSFFLSFFFFFFCRAWQLTQPGTGHRSMRQSNYCELHVLRSLCRVHRQTMMRSCQSFSLDSTLLFPR